MSQMTVITGADRRRRWDDEQKRLILSACFAPGGTVAETARRFDVCTSLIYRWRRDLATVVAPGGFAPAVLSSGPDPVVGTCSHPAVVVELKGGARVSIAASASARLVAATLRALR
ncbi:MAG: transposase [Caulobacteraceae bacterium]